MMLKFEDMKIDKELQELLPVLTMDEYEKLEQDILKYGVLDPIKVWQEPKTKEWVIIDGHNRHSILQKHIDEIDRLYNAWTGFKIMYEEELHNRDEVKQWMLEQQLGRRNLSDIERYEIVQRFKNLFIEQAKKNQSKAGGDKKSSEYKKSLTENLPQANNNENKERNPTTDKRLSDMVGISESTYRKLDKVMKSDNEEVKQQLREKKISIDKAYKEIKSPKVSESITPEQQIDKLDKRITDIDKMIESLQTEKSEIIKKRSTIFYGLEIKCPVKYRWIKGNYFSEYPSWWKCQIYIENNGVEEVFGNYSVYSSEHPDTFWKNREDIKGFDREKIPEKYVNDFRMVWKQAHDELMKIQKEKDKKDEEELQKAMESAKKQDDIMKKVINMIPDDDDKVILKKFYRVLASTYHPDNEKTGDADMMQYVNDLKQIWGI